MNPELKATVALLKCNGSDTARSNRDEGMGSSIRREVINNRAVGGPANGKPEWATPDLIAHTREVWQPYYSYRLTDGDAIAIIKSVSGLFQVLSRESDDEAVCCDCESQ